MSCCREKMVVVSQNGFTLEKSEDVGRWEKIFLNNHPEFTVCLGDMVISNGSYAVAEGTQGIVVKIDLPYENSRTSDILEVWFNGQKDPISMKFKDLKFEWQ